MVRPQQAPLGCHAHGAQQHCTDNSLRSTAGLLLTQPPCLLGMPPQKVQPEVQQPRSKKGAPWLISTSTATTCMHCIIDMPLTLLCSTAHDPPTDFPPEPVAHRPPQLMLFIFSKTCAACQCSGHLSQDTTLLWNHSILAHKNQQLRSRLRDASHPSASKT